ncbi:acyltransferase [Methanosarcina mazei]|uniref:acyltransferase n=1 Tax=Methanosarcina mazei TaxID=2209 RepID=UPI0009BBE28F|nr:acyltransferase [Methanosarcina mazei]
MVTKMGITLAVKKIKAKICVSLARYPFTYRSPSFWWRKCGFTIGKNTIISPYCLLWSNYSTSTDNIVIEDDVVIGPNVTLIGASHQKEDIAKYGKIVTTTKGKIVIKKGSWIGAGSIILPNVTIYEGAIVGAGAVVTKDVEPYTIVVGVPAKKIDVVK